MQTDSVVTATNASDGQDMSEQSSPTTVANGEHHAPQITPPPKLPPAPPRTALLTVGTVLLLLVLGAGLTVALTFAQRQSVGQGDRGRIGSDGRDHPSHGGKSLMRNWCCRAPCRPTRNRPFTPAPTDICCAGTKTLAAISKRANCWPTSILRKLTRN